MERPAAASLDAANVSELGTLLKKLRGEAGLSQQTLAERARISVQAVSALERGYRRAPYRATLERIAEALALPAQMRQLLEQTARRERGPRLVPERPPHDNLPRQLTSFLGRDDVVETIAGLAGTAPLVSIVGTGGVGKTRVAIEVARKLLDRFSHGVWLVEFGPIQDPGLVPHALAEALHVQESTHRTLLDTLSSYLSRKNVLIVLDNCEHVISEIRTVAGTLLRASSHLALLATSREPLGIAGERVFHMPSLAVPERDVSSPARAMQYGSVALFADRVRAVDFHFAVTADNVAPVVEICRRLEGLPLAIELAAARASVLSPREICAHLDRTFELLTASGPAAVPRHATMRAAIDWSYELLSERARLLFDRLAIFAGGFTLETATAVCQGDGIQGQDILDSLSLLIAQSLVMVHFTGGATRYDLLEATRQYALEKLASRGELQTVAGRHALSLLEVAKRLDREWYGAPERDWFRAAKSELDNFRLALGWALGERHDVRTGSLLAAALARLWYSLAPVEGRRWVRLAIDSIDETTDAAALAQLHLADAELSGALGESDASLASAERALHWRSALDDLQRTRAEHAEGSALAAMGRGPEGEALLHQTLAAAERLQNRRLQALVLSDLGTARARRGDVADARRFYGEALALYTALGLERPAASIAGHLAEVEFEAGDAAAALHSAEEARIGHAATGNRRSEVADLNNMAAYLIALDCFDDAAVYVSQALEAAHELQVPVLTAFALQHLAAIKALAARPGDGQWIRDREQAALLLGFVESTLQSLGAHRDYTERQEYDRVLSSLRATFAARLDDMMDAGSRMTEEDAVAHASLTR